MGKEEQELITTKYHEEAVMVKVMGLVAIIKGDEFLVGIEIKVTEAVKIRRLARCSSSNIFITSIMSKSMYDPYLEPAVGKFLGMVYMHFREITILEYFDYTRLYKTIRTIRKTQKTAFRPFLAIFKNTQKYQKYPRIHKTIQKHPQNSLKHPPKPPK